MLSTEGKNIMETKGGRKLLSGRLVSLVLALSMIMSFLPFAAITVSAYGGGTGTSSNPYLISSVAHLQELAAAVNGGAEQEGVYFKMTSNIALNVNTTNNLAGAKKTDGTVNDLGQIGWEGRYFRGVFDGNGYAVSGLNINNDIRGCGLFGGVAGNAIIRNLGVTNSVIYGNNWGVGSIVGTLAGSAIVENCYSAGCTVGMTSKTCNVEGGIVGMLTSGIVRRCWNSSTVVGPCASGGIAGFNCGIIEDCYNIGKISAGSQWAGIAGRNDATIRRCYNAGLLTTNGSNEPCGWNGSCGAMSGLTVSYDITNCYCIAGMGEYTDAGQYGERLPSGNKVTAAQMREAAMITKLGANFKRDKTWVNSGYPVLSTMTQNVIPIRVELGNLTNNTYNGSAKAVSFTVQNAAGADIKPVLDAADYTITYTCTNPSYNSTTPPTNAGSYTVKFALTATGKKYYSLADVTRTMVIDKATGTMNVPDSVTKTYGDAAIPVGITLNNSEQKSTLTYASTAASVASVTVNNNSDRTNATLKFGNAGTATITVSAPASANYTAATRTFPVTVNRAQGVITNEPPATINKNMRDADFLLGAGLNNSEQKLSYIFPSAQEVMQLDQNTGLIHLLNPGTTEITLLAPQSANWLQAEGTHKITLNVAGTAPDAPTLTAETGKPGMVPLKWTKPGFDGGDQIKSYTILRRIKPESGSSSAPFLPIVTVSDGSTLQDAFDHLEYSDTSVRNGTTYEYKITASNSIGTSVDSAVAEARPYAPPGGGLYFTATGTGNNEITLSWERNPDNGGDVVSNYRVNVYTDPEMKTQLEGYPQEVSQVAGTNPDHSFTPENPTFEALVYKAVITGVEQGKTYYFGLDSQNKAGWNNNEDGTSKSTTSGVSWTPPTQTQNPLAVVRGKNRIGVRWDPPTSNGGTPVTDYRVRYRKAGTEEWSEQIFKEEDVLVTPAMAEQESIIRRYRAFITGLEQGVKYEFKVNAINASSGEGGAATDIVSAVPAEKPGVPIVGKVESRNRGVMFTSLTADNCGDEIIAYRIFYKEEGAEGELQPLTRILATNGTVTNRTASNLQNNRTYEIAVKAENSYGESAMSQSSFVKIGLPTTPENFTLTPQAGQMLDINFDESEGQGSPITGYDLYIGGTVDLEDCETNTVEINGNTYKYGEVIRDVQTTDYAYNGSSRLNGDAITVFVVAKNSVGTSDPTEILRSSVGAPSAPVMTSCVTSPDGITVSWKASAANGTAIQHYYVHVMDENGNEVFKKETGSKQYQTSINNSDNEEFQFEPGEQYIVRVTCMNGAGESLPSNSMSFRFAAPGEPNNVEATADDGTLTVSWNEPSNDGGYDIVGYYIYLNNDKEPTAKVGWREVAGENEGDPVKYQLTMIDYRRDGNTEFDYGEGQDNTESFEVVIGGLANGYAYTARVAAINEKGGGVAGITDEPQTPRTKASEPVDIKAEGVGAAEVKVTWKQPLSNGGTPVSGYKAEGYITARRNDSTGVYETVERTKVWDNGSELIKNTTVTATGLEAGCEYEFEVTAYTEAEFGTTGISNSAKTFTKPGAAKITALESEVGDKEQLTLTVRWEEPEYTGGSPIAGYDVYINNAFKMNLSGIIPAGTTEYVINDSRIERGMGYDVTVYAYNEAMGTRKANGTPSESEYIMMGTVPPPRELNISFDSQLNTIVSWDTDQYIGMEQYIDRYSVYIDGKLRTTTKTNSAVIKMLQPGVKHTIEVSVYSTFGQEGNKSAPCEFTIGGAAKVTGVTVTPGEKSGRVSWTKTEPFNNDPEYEVTNYHVYLDGTEVKVVGAEVTQVDLADLTGGKDYKVSVSAENQYGNGPKSDEVKLTPWTNPTAPIADDITPGVGSFSFTVSGANGGGVEISRYKVFVDSEEASDITVEGDKITVGGVTDGTEHSFYLVTVNEKGLESGESTTYKVVTGVPSAPQNLSAIAGTQEISLSFDAVSEVSAEHPVENYNIYMAYKESSDVEEKNELVATVPAETGRTSYTHRIDGLTDGTKYTFTVCATNDVGTGAISDSLTVVSGAPCAPIISRIVPRGGRLTVEWDAPSENAGRVTKYTVYVNGMASVTTPDLSATLTGLENGTIYTITVSASNYVGEGEKSEPVMATPGGAPEAVENVKWQADYTEEDGHFITITWDAPSDNGGITITSYAVTGAEGNIQVDSAARTAVITGLEEATDYTFSVVAINDAGDGVPYTTEAIRTLSRPGAPELQALESYNNSLIVTWTAPEETGGTIIDKFKVYAEDLTDRTGNTVITWEGKPTIDENGEYTATLTAGEDTGLVTGNTYKVSVAAINAVGEGEKSSSIRTKLNDNLVASAPGAPLNVSAEASDGKVTITWNAPAKDGNSSITNYIIFAGTSEETMGRIGQVDGYTFTYTDSNLRNGTTRYYKVRALNAADPNGGPFSETVSATPVKIDPPTVPTWPELNNESGISAYEMNASGTEMTLNWNASTGSELAGKISYRIFVDSTMVDTVTDTTSYVLKDLNEGTKYNIRITAVNELGGEASGEYIRASKGLNIRKGSAEDGFKYDDQYAEGIFANIDADYNGDEDTKMTYSVPSEPIEAQVSNEETKAKVTWKKPTNTGNRIIDKYFVYVNGTKAEVNAVSALAEGETAENVYAYTFDIAYGEPYVVYVSAHNSMGEGRTTDPMYLSLATDAPTNISAAVKPENKREIVLTWDVPSNGVTQYKIWADGKAEVVEKDSLTVNDNGTVSWTYQNAEINHNYIFAVSALYGDKSSVQSPTCEILTEDIAANAPTDLLVEESGEALTVTWSAPTNVDASDIAKYILYINGEAQATEIAGTATSALISQNVNVGQSILVKLQAVSPYDTAGAMSETFRYYKEEPPIEDTAAPGKPINMTAGEPNIVDGILVRGEPNVTVTWEQPEPNEQYSGTAAMYKMYINGEYSGFVTTPEFSFEAAPGRDYEIKAVPSTGINDGPSEAIIVSVPANVYAKPVAPTIDGSVSGDKKNITITWDAVEGVDYYLIVNGEEEPEKIPADGRGNYTYTFPANGETEYAFVVKAVKEYDPEEEGGNKIQTEERSNMLQISISDTSEQGSYLANKTVITGTVSNGNMVKVFWTMPEKKTDELGEIAYFKVLAGTEELAEEISPADVMSATVEFASMSEKKNVRIRAYKIVSGNPFCASTSDIWVATPGCNVIDDPDTFDGLNGDNPPFDDNGKFKPEIPVNNKDTEGTGEVEITTGVEIKIPIVINVSDANVEFVDQYSNTILETVVAAKADGTNEIVFKTDQSESELSSLMLNIVITRAGATSYTLKGVPFSELASLNMDTELVLGDLNGDGKITVIDRSLLVKNLNKSNQTLETGDLNGDGKVTVIDRSLLTKNLNKSSKTVTWSK